MYASVDELKSRLLGRFDGIYTAVKGEGDDAAETWPEAEKDLADASSEIDGMLANRYGTPVTAEKALPILNDWTLTLAVEKAYMRSAGDELPKKVIYASTEVRNKLKLAASGDFRLMDVPEISSGAGGISIVSGSDPVFPREKMTGF